MKQLRHSPLHPSLQVIAAWAHCCWHMPLPGGLQAELQLASVAVQVC
jgi:hypothetical protein